MKGKHLIGMALAIAFIMALGWAGNQDRVDTIIVSMPESTYREIKDSLYFHGEFPSEEEIAEFYINNY